MATTSLTVLLAEDDADYAHLVQVRAGGDPDHPVSVTRVPSLDAALVALTAGPFDLVLLGLGLPESTGLATFERVHEAFPDVPVLVLTGTDDLDLARACVRAGAYDYLVKGRGEPILSMAVHVTVERARLQRRLDEAINEQAALALERGNAVRALHASEVHHRLLAENVRDVIWTSDLDLRFTYVSPAVLQVTGYTVDEALTQTIDTLLTPSSREQVVQALARELSSATSTPRYEWPARNLEIEQVRKDGRVIWVEVSAGLLRGPDGRPVGLLGVTRDITERKTLQAQLMKADRLASVGLLAAGVAHEINNPMTIVMNCAELIGDDVPPDSPIAANARAILDASQRVVTIVRNLLAFSRQESDKRSPARVVDIVGRTVSLVRKVLQKSHVRIEVAVSADLPLVRCRSNQIAQVLLNLLTNARDALVARYPGEHPDKVVTITAAEIDLNGHPGVRVTVEDHGAGVPEGIRDRIFDPFFTTKPRDQGTGLGLALSLGLVQEHGGKLWHEGVPTGGERFHVELPIEEGGS
jgi:PAS domain S-box-containing protein